LQQLDRRPDAIFGLSDTIALAARDAGHALGLVDAHTRIVGINGDPLALAAIAKGSMTATVETSTEDLGIQALKLALQAAQNQPLPAHFNYKSRLVTAQNVGEVSAQKLMAIADLPSRLVGFNRQEQQARVVQLETSLEINRRVGSILDARRLSSEIANLIRERYGYDQIGFYRWLEADQGFVLDESDPRAGPPAVIPLAQAGVLGDALARNAPLFIPDVQRSTRLAQDPMAPATRSRVVLPVRFSDTIVGVLDLHSYRSTQHTRRELVGLQALADQLGIGIRNAELYSEAVQAKAVAEKADQLKTRLLANVSHELRTPLDIILGYSRAAPGGADALTQEQIHRSAEHLKRLINDLLDLSRAEVNELDLAPELLDARGVVEEVFNSLAHQAVGQQGVAWQLELPARLPLIQADPVRLRQILLNLLSNARKFTERGEIVLGAETVPPDLHLWVRDTGPGIPLELQERIFEPFVTAEQPRRRGEGIGLGLSITRRLVALHHGTLTLESAVGRGSTFHLYLPLPTLENQLPAPGASGQTVLLVISRCPEPAPEIAALAARQGWTMHRLDPATDIKGALAAIQPTVLAAIAADTADLLSGGAREAGLAEYLPAAKRLRHLPFVLYSARLADELGLTGIVVKPIGAPTLRELLRALGSVPTGGPILIVDDDPQARELYRQIVASAFPGCPIQTAGNGAEALHRLAESTPGAVLLDLTMPEVDGFQLLDWLRADARTRRVPVLVLSGRLLSAAEVQRLEQHTRVTWQSKEILTAGETAAALRQVLSGADALAQPTSALVKRAVAYLQQNYSRALSRQEIAHAIGVTENYLSRIFREELGLSPWDFVNRYRIKHAKELLRNTNESVTAIALQVGFENPAYFTRVFRQQTNQSPREYRKG
jgi:signal transduction histidine kinase/CheY-like chemotaxis protein